MELADALRTTGAVRDFEARAVPPEVVHRVLDAARFAPNGGNRQAWRVIVLEDPARRAALRDLYVDTFHLYKAQVAAGLRPWAPHTDRVAEAEARAAVADVPAADRPTLGPFADGFDEVPLLLVVLADLRLLAAMDRDLDRYTFIGGASIYPFVWSILLAAHGEGLGGVLTTMAIAREPELKELLEVPDDYAVAAVLGLGYPSTRATKLTRGAVDEFTTVDTFDGPVFEGS